MKYSKPAGPPRAHLAEWLQPWPYKPWVGRSSPTCNTLLTEAPPSLIYTCASHNNRVRKRTMTDQPKVIRNISTLHQMQDQRDHQLDGSSAIRICSEPKEVQHRVAYLSGCSQGLMSHGLRVRAPCAMLYGYRLHPHIS